MAASAPQRSTNLSEILTANVARKANTTTKVAVEENAFPNIETNQFHQIMFSESLSPEQKRDEVAKLLTFASTKEESRAMIKAYQEFEEYMQDVREKMAQAIIRMTDTEAFSELKTVYDDLNNSLIDFDDKMKPLTDIIDAIYTLRTNDKTVDAFKEIQNDRKSEQEIATKTIEIKSKFDNLNNNIDQIQDDIDVLSEDKSLFGFGGIRKSAREEIARKQNELTKSQENLDKLSTELAEMNNKHADASQLGEFAAQKAKLRELLDISTDEHKERQKDLVESALSFVKTAKERIGSVRNHLGQMNDQVENLYDTNNRMSGVYAIMGEGIKVAEKTNQELRDKVLPPEGEENMMEKMLRDEKKTQLEDHIKLLDSAAANTVSTYADLTSQTIRIKSMKDANEAQIANARVMHSQGVAGVADRLSVVLQAVSSAAIGESSAMSKDTLQKMIQSTNKVAQKEVIRNAVGINDTNNDLMKAIDDLGEYGEVIRAATNISRQGVTEMRDKLDQIKQIAEGVQADIHDSIAVNAEVGRGNTKKEEKVTVLDKGPFKF